MELGIITDEVHEDFETACEHIGRWGLPLAEVRNVNGKNVTQIDDAEVAHAVAALKENDLRVSGIASPVFKSPFDEKTQAGDTDFSVAGAVTVDAQLELLERACELATAFNTKLVRVFTFLRIPWSDAVVDEIVTRMLRAVEIAARHGVVLAVENEPACVVGTGAELGAFFSKLDAALSPELLPRVGALWDPGNALSLGEEEPYPHGYEALPKDRLVHVHLKDATAAPATLGTFVPLGEGRVDYAGQFAALRRDGYQGSVVLEPHYSPPGVDSATAARDCVTAAQRLLDASELDK